MDQLLLQRFDQEMRRELIIPDMRKDVFPWGVRFIRPAPGLSYITYYQGGEDRLEATIQEQIRYFQEHEQRFSWKVYEHDQPHSLSERLIANGFEPDEPGTVMVLDLNDIPAELLTEPQADLRPIQTRAGLSDVILVLEAVWGGSFAWVSERMGNHFEIPGYLSVWAAYVAAEPVSIGWTYYPPGSQFASLWGGSTLEEQRGRGFYRAILARRVQEAIQRGRAALFVEAGPLSQPIVERCGFRKLTVAQDFERKPAG